MRSFAVMCLVGVLSLGCQSMEGAGFPEFELKDYPAGVSCPTAHTDEPVGWYLNQIEALFVAAGPHSVAMTEEFNWGLEYRRNAPHPGHPPLLSWVRIQTAYRHAIDGFWGGAVSKLGHAPGNPIAGWEAFDGTLDCSKTVAQMLSDMEARLNAQGHFGATAPPLNQPAVQRAVNRRMATPYAYHSADATWMHVYLAYETANLPFHATNTPGMWIVDWTICELLHEA